MDTSLERLESALSRNGDAALPTHGPRSAVAALLRDEGAGLEVLLMKRIEREDDRWSGQVSLPGGHHQEEDGDLLTTAVRETREEVGVDLVRSARLLGHLAPVRAKARGRVLALLITPFVFVQSRLVTPRAGEEAEEAFWFPVGRALRGELDAVYRYEHAGRHLDLPGWRHGGHLVWGLTREILLSLGRSSGVPPGPDGPGRAPAGRS